MKKLDIYNCNDAFTSSNKIMEFVARKSATSEALMLTCLPKDAVEMLAYAVAGCVDHALIGGLAVSIVAGDTWLFCDFGVRKTDVVFDDARKAELLKFYGL